MAVNGLLLLYFLLVHAAILSNSGWLKFAALVVFAAELLAPWLGRAHFWAWGALGVATIASAVFVRLGEGLLFLYAASALVPAALMWFFGRTLLPGETPLVTRIADSMAGPLSAPVQGYTRGVTGFWTAALAAVALANVLLALWATPIIWSLFANLLNYFFIGALFVAEWLFRCWYLRGHESMTWRQYVRALVHLDLRRILT